MLFTPSTTPLTAYDPIEHERLETGRPASRAEVIQRQRRHIVEDALAMSVDHNAQDARATRSAFQFLPETLDGIRRSLSRALVNAGHRIGPEAA